MTRALLLVVAATLTMAVPARTQQSATLPPVAETRLDVQTREVSSQLRCVVCQGLSIQDSPADLAREMRAVVREQLAAGRTPDQVKQYFVQRYGEMVLLRPEPSGFNLLVYAMPVVMLLFGTLFVFLKAKQWTRSRAEQTPAWRDPSL
jgi:cytochrome c-type biogenesis protein CcmH